MTDHALPGADPREQALRRTVTAPEGIVLQVRLATFGERVAAVLLDLLLIAALLVAVFLLALLLPGPAFGTPAALILVMLISFAVRSFYFAFFELKWRGATPGKRALHLRVIDRRGGPLRADAVMARNLMREIELFLPLTLLALLEPGQQTQWTVLLALVWAGLLALLPLFNRDRLRAGDMIAGTWVIAAPRPVLLPDVAASPQSLPAPSAGDGSAEEAYRFTERQLAVYGVYELQVLEDVLRRSDGGPGDVYRTVADRIRRKIGYEPPGGGPVDPRLFLEAFYRAQRARLETDLTFGRHRADKHGRGR